MSTAVAQRYAQALFDTAMEASKLDAICQDMNNISRLMEQSGDFARFLENPAIPAGKRQIILNDIFHGKIDALTYRFLLFLEAKKRLGHLKSICTVFERLYAHARGILKAKWTSGVELSAPDVHALTDCLKAKFESKEVDVSRHLDSNILGGIKIQVGDTVFDYTIQTQLKKFKQAVMAA